MSKTVHTRAKTILLQAEGLKLKPDSSHYTKHNFKKKKAYTKICTITIALHQGSSNIKEKKKLSHLQRLLATTTDDQLLHKTVALNHLLHFER